MSESVTRSNQMSDADAASSEVSPQPVHDIAPRKLREPSGWLRFLSLFVVTAAIAHLLTAFYLSEQDSRSAYTKLAASIEPLTFHKIDNTSLRSSGYGKAARLPFLGADAINIVCVFSSEQAPVWVQAELPDRAWTAGVYRDDGTTAYFATAIAGRPTTIDLKIVPDVERFQGLTPQARGRASSGPPPINVVTAKGLIVIRAPDRGASYRNEQDTVLAKAACGAHPSDDAGSQVQGTRETSGAE